MPQLGAAHSKRGAPSIALINRLDLEGGKDFDGGPSAQTGEMPMFTVMAALLGPVLDQVVTVVFVVGALVTSVGAIETGNVGVETRFGTVAQQEINPGLYVAPFATVNEYSTKEIAVSVDNLTPKAADNLFIKHMDVTVYYRVLPGHVAPLVIKYAGQSEALPDTSGVLAPSYRLVLTLARNAIYQEVAKIKSLEVHQQRERIADDVQALLQKELQANDPGAFQVTRVVVRTVVTDPAIEQAIQDAVNQQKRLEAMQIRTQIAQKEAEIRLTEAMGIAKANEAINHSLTPEYLQHEVNEALRQFAEKGGTTTVVLPASMNVAPLINLPAPTPR
jgi:regulator of protease activity HflC (stomatin/prohibitin superfamily)